MQDFQIPNFTPKYLKYREYILFTFNMDNFTSERIFYTGTGLNKYQVYSFSLDVGVCDSV